MTRVAIYMRVSTDSQTTDNQKLELEHYCEMRGWVITDVFEDCGISGSRDDRRGLNGLKQAVVKGRFDIIVVWKFDRMARSSAHLLECLTLFNSHQVGFVSITESIDTTSPMGKMVFTFIAAIAEFERELIKERVIAGLNRAKAEGIRLGRPRKGFDIAEALRMRREGKSYNQISKAMCIGKSTVFKYLSEMDAQAVHKTPDEESA